MEEQNTYPVKDLSLASFLFASEEVNFIKVERQSNQIVIFHFSPINKAKELADAYWSNTAPAIQPRKLFSSQRDLKDLIFSAS